MKIDRRLLRLLRDVQFLFGLVIFFGSAAGLGAILQARLLSGVIAGVHVGGLGLAELMTPLWLLLLVIAGRAVSAFLSERLAAALARQVKSRLRDLLTAKLFRVGPLFTHNQAAGELASVYVQGVDALDAYFSQYLPQVLFAGILPLAALIFVFPIDWISGLILAFTGPLIPLFMFLIGSNAERLTRRQFGAMRRMSAFFLDTLQGLRALKELGRSREQAAHVEAVSEDYRQTTLSVLRVTFLSALALELLGTISTALIAVQIGLRLLYGRMSFEPAFFLLLIAPEFYLPLRTLGLRFHASMNGVSAARRIFGVLDEAEPAQMATSPEGSARLPGAAAVEIRFEEVSFQYPQRDAPALDGFSCALLPGKLTALVGESGAGKSTAMWLLLRFAAPQSGQVLVNGVDLQTLPVAAWRERLSWVPQKPYLLNGTILENLRVAKEDARDDDVERACALANLGPWIETLPQGLHTRIGEGGARVSGGQAQRLALARAFLRDAPVLLLDEPTAHLDPPEETLLIQAVRRICADRTVLMVAHRLSSVYQADQIVVMAQGKAVETGQHAELAHTGGAYARLIAAYGGRT